VTAINAKAFAQRFEALGDYLSTTEIEELLRHLPRQTIAAGEVLLREGEGSENAYLLWEGSLKVALGSGDEAIDIGRIEPGTLVGEIAFLDGGAASATVSATSEGTLLTLSRGELEKLRTTHPRIATSLLRALCKSLAARVRGASAALDRLRGVEPSQKKGGFLEGLRTLFGLAKD
jgi:CRP-like cAMP-binding protein